MALPRPVLIVGWALHRGLHRLTGGRMSTEAPANGKVGTLFLVSTGRRSGKKRRNGLFYIEDGDAFVVVASNAGDGANPQWWRNLQVTPDAVVDIGTGHIPVRARDATPEERDRLWPVLDAGYPNFAQYRAQTTRSIPIVILERRDADAAAAAES
jgi:F420H(2)-dependent quinone reductase